MNEKMIGWFFLLCIGICLITGCASRQKVDYQVERINVEDIGIKGSEIFEIVPTVGESGETKYFKFKKVEKKLDRTNEKIYEVFDIKEQLLLKAIGQEGGNTFDHGAWLNDYRNICEETNVEITLEGYYEYLIVKGGPMYGQSGGNFIKRWWTKVKMNYNLLLEMEYHESLRKGKEGK